eukprot:GFUD01044577.1.p1 GENE.GFUD01044577.1~~GFUD01044577.1.p1  ORF type:complete len:952 (+),score=235.97 GFUD01044577.1:97-2952(+)
MDLSASSRIITSALTSLGEPPHEYSDDIQDEIHLEGEKDDPDPGEMYDGMIDPMNNMMEVHPLMSSNFNFSFSPDPGFLPETEFSLPQEMTAMSTPQDSSTQDLVLAAISVMKGRKARPDTKRLCNWVHRKYGRSVQEVVNEIDSLCAQGVLDKVEYKGSISFRIVSDRKMHKRAGRRKSSHNNVIPEESYTEPGSSQVKPETPKKSPSGSAKKSPKKSEKSPEKNQPLTINFIVNEQLRPEAGVVITRRDIIKSIETSMRPINKKNVFRDLETILAQEIHLGYLLKINEDEFSLPFLENAKTYRGTIALKVSKRKPKPTQKILEMEAELLSKARQEKMDEEKKVLGNIENKFADSKTEDQLKDDLIKEKLISNKLFKMKSKMKTAKIKLKKDKAISSMIRKEIKPLETGIDAIQEKQINLNKIKESIDQVSENSDKIPDINERKEEPVARKLKKKKETWQVSDNKEKHDLHAEKEKPLRKNVFTENILHNAENPKGSISAKNQDVKNDKRAPKEEKVNGTLNETETKVKSKVELKKGTVSKKSQIVKKEKSPGTKLKRVGSHKGNTKKIRTSCKKENERNNSRNLKDAEKEKPKEKARSIEKESMQEIDDIIDKTDDEKSNPMPDLIPSRAASGRKKRARKIFDPADHDLPARVIKKCRVSSPPPFTEEKVKEEKEKGKSIAPAPSPKKKPTTQSKSKSKPDPESDPEPDACLYCDLGDMKNEKLISCKDCQTIVHPSCLNYPEDLTDQIYSQPWQCINCKTCFHCLQAGDDDMMLFCDSCDLGYHMVCHQPPISSKPHGRWECGTCAKHTGFTSQLEEEPEAALTLEEVFESALPPMPSGTGDCWEPRGMRVQYCPFPDMSPANWEDFPEDPKLPDITTWSAAKVSQYLVQNGIQEIHAKVFFDEEIDGSSVLVMQRKDVLLGLGLKLGPALKIYNRIRALQTRRTFNF